MNIRVAFACLFVVAGTGLFAQQTELFNPMKDALKTGNAKEVVKFFNTSVDMDIEGTVDTYSKTQAEQIIKDFFSKNPPSNYTKLHDGGKKDASRFVIGKLSTAKGQFRLTFLMVNSNGVLTINKFSIENDNN